jgi:hypothetical protein
MNYFSQLPQPDMLPFLSLFAYGMGGCLNALPGRTVEQSQPNDGIVNTESMDGPSAGPVQGHFPSNAVTNQAANGAGGVYWHLGKNVTMDHADEIGVFTDSNTVCWAFI